MEKPRLTKQAISARLRAKLETLVLGDASAIHPDVYRMPRLNPENANWDCSFTGVPASELPIVKSAADLLRREFDLA